MTKQIKLVRSFFIEYYAEQLKKLDMQPGECYAAFDRNHRLCAMFIFVENLKGLGGDILYKVKELKVLNRGFERKDIELNANYFRYENYTYIVQIDRKRFDKLDKAIGLVNAQINAYQGEFNKLIEE